MCDYFIIYEPYEEWYSVGFLRDKGTPDVHVVVTAKFTAKSDAQKFIRMLREEEADPKKAVPF